METNQTLFSHHRGPITCAATIPGTSSIITSGYDSALALFDQNTQEVNLLGYHEHLVNRVTVNSLGTLAVSASSDHTLIVWDLDTKEQKLVLQGHYDDVEDFTFISDELGASVSRDWRIILWDLNTGAIQKILLGHEKDVLSINYHEGKLYTAGDDMTLRTWDVSTGEQLSCLGPFDTETDSCAVDPLQQRVILGCDDGVVRIFDLTTQALLQELPGHDSGIKKVAVSPTTGDILSAAYDQKIIIWDHQTLQQKQLLAGQLGVWERSFNWSTDGQQVVAGTFDGTVLVWEASSGECLQELGLTEAPGNACFNDISAINHEEIVTVSDDGYVRTATITRDQADWQQKLLASSQRVLMNAVLYSSAQQQIITGSHHQKLQWFNKKEQWEQGQSLQLTSGPINSIRSAPWPNQSDLFVACYSGDIIQVNAQAEIVQTMPVHDNAVKALCLHPEQELGVSGCAEGGLIAWNLQGQIIRKYAGHLAIIDDVDIDPTGRLIASAGRDFTLKIHELETGVLLHNISINRRSPKALLFIDSNTVVIGNYWGELLYITLDNEKIQRLSVAKNGISAVTKLDENLVVASYDGSVQLINMSKLSILNRLQAMTQHVPVIH